MTEYNGPPVYDEDGDLINPGDGSTWKCGDCGEIWPREAQVCPCWVMQPGETHPFIEIDNVAHLPSAVESIDDLDALFASLDLISDEALRLTDD